jgi:hypothetical protein|tara:strand:- start:502 stop:1101 length:600 start_codon:yes stop_codon:yes gene_type:complete
VSKGIALIIFLVPIITICISYVISAFYGYVDWCLPIIDGCTSISKVGRYGISFYLYKILVIPSVILMIYFWLKVYLDVYKNIFLLFLSFIACIFLIIYLIALGFDGPIYRFMREVGIFAFFVFMPICQIWLTASAPKESLKTKFFLYLLILLFIGFCFVYFYILHMDNNNYENIIEWNFAFGIFLFFPIFSYSLIKINA